MRYLLYNPLSGRGSQAQKDAECYALVANVPTKILTVTEVENPRAFFENLEIGDDVVIFGGDGTLNKVANELCDTPLQTNIYYYPCGTGNDFARDIGITNPQELILINDYIKDLPTVTVNEKTAKFINGVGYGIDGYCCEVGDKIKAQHKMPNYTAIAIKGLLFYFKPVTATVTVDGEKSTFKKVWIAPTMFGRYYGGGMMPTPMQNRNDADKKVSLMLFHGTSKLKTLMIFPSLFKGEHVKHTEAITILQGKNITVEFDRPAPLQIDGETVLNVSKYTVTV